MGLLRNLEGDVGMDVEGKIRNGERKSKQMDDGADVMKEEFNVHNRIKKGLETVRHSFHSFRLALIAIIIACLFFSMNICKDNFCEETILKPMNSIKAVRNMINGINGNNILVEDGEKIYRKELNKIKGDINEVYSVLVNVISIINKSILVANEKFDNQNIDEIIGGDISTIPTTINDAAYENVQNEGTPDHNLELKEGLKEQMKRIDDIQHTVDSLEHKLLNLAGTINETNNSIQKLSTIGDTDNIKFELTNSVNDLNKKIVVSLENVENNIKLYENKLNSLNTKLLDMESLIKKDNTKFDINSIIEKLTKIVELDFVNEPDYVFYDAGGSVIEDLTSKTFKEYNQSLRENGGPDTVIKSGNLPGQCWGMSGKSGIITLKSINNIIPTSVTFDHTAVDIFKNDGVFPSAPKNIVLWAVYDPNLFSKYIYQKNKSRNPKILSQVEKSLDSVLVDNKTQKVIALRVDNFTFDPTKSHRMTFNIDYKRAILSLLNNDNSYSLADPRTQFFSFIIHDNWGNTDYTCIYRIRVHGMLNMTS